MCINRKIAFEQMDPERYEKYSRMSTGDDIMEWLHHSKEFADFTFLVGSGPKRKIILAHKFILRMSSPKFDNMLSSSETLNHIRLPDVEPNILELMLRNMYKQKIEFDSLQETLKVLSLASTYELSGLKEICLCHMESLMDTENACSVYQKCLSVEHDDLTFKSFKMIQEEAGSFLKQTQLEDVLPLTLEYILKQDHLSIHSELQLFEALVSWAKIQLDVLGKVESPENLRQVMDPFLKHVRFLCISEANFVKIQMDTEIFTDEELGKILMNYSVRNSCELPLWFNKNTVCRTCKCKSEEMDLGDHSSTRKEASLATKIPPNAIKSKAKDNPKNGDTICLTPRTEECSNLTQWVNISKTLYSHSDRVCSIASKFIAESNGFFLRRLMISICEDCFYHNRSRRRWAVQANVTIRTGAVVRKTPIEIPIRSGRFRLEHPKASHFELKEPMILMQYFDTQKLVFPQNVGMEAPIVHDYLDPDTSSEPRYVDVPPPLLSETIEIVPPVYVRCGDTLELSMKTATGDPFYCCEKKPSFEDTPFSVYDGNSKDERSTVWCAFASLDYFLPE